MLLAKQNYSVLIVERYGTHRAGIGETFAPAIGAELSAVGLWNGFQQLGFIPSFGTQSVWGDTDLNEHSHLFTAFQHGWQVDRVCFDNWLTEQASATGVSTLNASSIVTVTATNEKEFEVLITSLKETQKVTCKFLVDATGRKAALARYFEADRIVFDRLVGIASHWDIPEGSEQLATLVETVPGGWWYSNSVPGNKLSVILMTDADLVKERNPALAHTFDYLLHQAPHTGRRCKDQTRTGPPIIFTAVSQRVLRGPADDRPWLSIGDASLSVDPISGSGMIRAFRTARESATSIDHYLHGDRSAIEQYEMARNKECDEYLLELSGYYEIEKRWPGSLFWQRRHQLAAIVNV